MASEHHKRGWQAGKTLIECNRHMLEHQVACDLTFVVQSADGATVTIPAHKYILVSRSPVFEAMLSGPGKYQEDAGKIDILDIEAGVFRQMLRFLYTEEAEVTAHNVLYLMTAAKKYLLDTLELHCKDFLENNITPANVCTILNHSLMLGDTDLTEKCTVFARENAGDVFEAESFLELGRDTLRRLLGCDHLVVESEVQVFQACMKWAKHKLSDSELATGARLREILGDCVHQIRFASMTSQEFGKHVALSEAQILESKDFIWFSGLCALGDEALGTEQELRTLGYNLKRRHVQQPVMVTRYPVFACGWIYDRGADAISFRVDRAIHLYGVYMCGAIEGDSEHQCVVDVQDGATETWHRAAETTFKSNGNTRPVLVKTDRPIRLDKGHLHTVKVNIEGPRSFYGAEGLAAVTSNGVKFTFEESSESANETLVSEGVIPGLQFTSSPQS